MGHLGRLEVPRDLLLSICVHELAALDLGWGPEKHQPFFRTGQTDGRTERRGPKGPPPTHVYLVR